MSNYVADYSGSQINGAIGLFVGKGLDQVTGLVQRNADGTFSVGSGSDDVVVIQYGVTTYTDVLAAVNANKRIVLQVNNDSDDFTLFYVNFNKVYTDTDFDYIDFYAIGYNSYIWVRVNSMGSWRQSNTPFITNVEPSTYNIIYNSSTYYETQLYLGLVFNNYSVGKAFIYDNSSNTNGVGLILSYNETSTSTYNRIEFTALFCNVSTSAVYKVKYRVQKSTSTYNETWSRQVSTELQDKLVSGTSIKTINNTSLLGSGNIDIAGGVSDVTVDGTSIVSAQGVAELDSNFKVFELYTPDGPGTLSTYEEVRAAVDYYTANTASTFIYVNGSFCTFVYDDGESSIEFDIGTALEGSNSGTLYSVYCDYTDTSHLQWEYLTLEVQEKLESGINIKTINNNSILGSGNLTIDGGCTVQIVRW